MAAIVTITNAMAPTYHYVFKDHLGSILRVTNAAGTPEADQSFDAWGRRRNPTTWAYTGATAPTQTWLYRGYTAHEHLDQFALINMNGRLYDPTVGRMLSPDNYVQDALYAQTFNRYSYAHNNPLKFTDPDGENPAVVVGAVLGGLINLGVGIWRGEVHDLWDGIVYFGTGAAIGALAGATGGTSLAGGATSVLGGIYSGAITGAATGAWSGMLQGIANATWQTIRYHAPASNIAKAGGEGLVAGAISGAIIGGTVGGIKAALKGLPFSPKTAPKVTPTPAGTGVPHGEGDHGFVSEVELTDGTIKTEGTFAGDEIRQVPQFSIEKAVWAQKTFSGTFSADGKFAGQTVGDVAGMLRDGTLSITDVPVDVVVRNGQTFILNTRSSAALMLADIPRNSWNVIDRTSVSLFENLLTGQLTRNGLINGTNIIRQSGTQLILTH